VKLIIVVWVNSFLVAKVTTESLPISWTQSSHSSGVNFIGVNIRTRLILMKNSEFWDDEN
jgi:hypothetical protein